MEIAQMVLEAISDIYFDLSAILCGLLGYFVVRRKRSENGLKNLDTRDSIDIMFSGTKLFFLVVLCLGAFIPKLLELLLQQQRVLLFFTLLFAIFYEQQRLVDYYRESK